VPMAGLERESVVGVLEKDHGFVSRLEREGVVLLRVVHVRGDLVVGIALETGRIEFAQADAGFHHPAHGDIHFLFGDKPLLDGLAEIARRSAHPPPP
jgi:hypothetical protein